jgi:hypothetical protein
MGAGHLLDDGLAHFVQVKDKLSPTTNAEMLYLSPRFKVPNSNEVLYVALRT